MNSSSLKPIAVPSDLNLVYLAQLDHRASHQNTELLGSEQKKEHLPPENLMTL